MKSSTAIHAPAVLGRKRELTRKPSGPERTREKKVTIQRENG